MAEKTCERCEHFEPSLRGCWRGERNVRDASGKPRMALPSVQPEWSCDDFEEHGGGPT